MAFSVKFRCRNYAPDRCEGGDSHPWATLPEAS